MCAMHMMFKTGMVFIRLAEPNFIFYRICVRSLRTQIRRLIPEDLALPLNQVLSLCSVPLLPPILSGGDM